LCFWLTAAAAGCMLLVAKRCDVSL
jgi:hypothetical protein